MGKAEAGQLLQSTQRLRVYWGTLIYATVGYTWALFIGIWSFLFKSYTDAVASQGRTRDPVDYLLYAVAATSVILGIWRWATRSIDLRLARLFPTFVSCEIVMEVPSDLGTLAYITDHVLNKFRSSLPSDKDALLKGIKYLVYAKRFGTRGQGSIDIFGALIIALQFFFSVRQEYALLSFIASMTSACSLGMVLFAHLRYQRNPRRKDIVEAFGEAK